MNVRKSNCPIKNTNLNESNSHGSGAQKTSALIDQVEHSGEASIDVDLSADVDLNAINKVVTGPGTAGIGDGDIVAGDAGDSRGRGHDAPVSVAVYSAAAQL